MENTTEYYTPELNEFYVGFEYEHKESFFDGTVKKKLQFENSNWIKEKFEISSFSYIERALNGKNAINFLCGIRVKKLSRECIESLGWKKINYKEESSENKELKEWKFIYNNTFLILTIVNDIQKNVWIYKDTKTMYFNEKFNGNVKNKSELSKLMTMLNIKI